MNNLQKFISYDEYLYLLEMGCHFDGYVENLGYVNTEMVWWNNPCPRYPFESWRYYTVRDSFKRTDYVSVIVPTEDPRKKYDSLTAEDITKALVQISPDGSAMVNMGNGKIVGLGKKKRIDISINENFSSQGVSSGKVLRIQATDYMEDGFVMLSSHESIIPFSEFDSAFPSALGGGTDSDRNYDYGMMAFDLSLTLTEVLGERSEQILRNRGKYMPRNTKPLFGKPFSMKKTGQVTIRSAIGNVTVGAKALNWARVGGKALGWVGAGYSIYTAGRDTYNNSTVGNYTKVGVRAAIIGIAFIPGPGWIIALGLGVSEAIWGDDLYNWIDQ